MERRLTTAKTDIFERQERTNLETSALALVLGGGLAASWSGLLLWCAFLTTCARYLTTSKSFDGWERAASDALVVATQPKFFLVVALSVFVLVSVSIIYKCARIKEKGASVVARDLGGERLAEDSQEGQRLRNVVEETALAAGIPAPEIFVLKAENQINAFAVGKPSRDAALGITGGAVRRLPRDELHAIVAHEVGHLLSEDSDKKTRSIGTIFGLRAVETIGRKIALGAWACCVASAKEPFEIAATDEKKSAEQSDEDKAFAALATAIFFAIWAAICWAVCLLSAALCVVAFGVWAIGAASVFFAGAVQAAIFRRREFIADDEAARLTRNPTALAKLLRRIQYENAAPTQAATQAPETARLFFASVFPRGWKAYIFRTHPDLRARIARLDPAILDWEPN